MKKIDFMINEITKILMESLAGKKELNLLMTFAANYPITLELAMDGITITEEPITVKPINGKSKFVKMGALID